MDIPTLTRVCAVTGRELMPGERIYGALFDEAGKFVFAGRSFQELAILGDGGQLSGTQALAEAGSDQLSLVRTELDATVIVYQGTYKFELTVFHE